MDIFLSPQAWLWAGLIFGLRVLEMALDTLRMLVVIRGRRALAWLVGLGQSLIFVVAITSVLQNVDNPLTVLGYAAGFATGVVLGMWLEERLAIGFAQLTMVSTRWGPAIAERLRGDGFAVTEIPGRGKDGTVSTLNCSVLRKHVDKVTEAAKGIDPTVFITAEELRPLRRGFWRA